MLFYPIYTNKLFLTREFINLAVNYVIFRFFSRILMRSSYFSKKSGITIILDL